jgi:hypothetical protein
VYAGDTLDLTLTSYDPDGTIPEFWYDNLPAAAVFTDNGDGTANVYWEPQVADTGTYEVLFGVTDGELADSELVVITVQELSTCCIGLRGNASGDDEDAVNIADLTYIVAYLFGIGPQPECMEEADVNGNGLVNIADLTYLVAYLFAGGPAPVPCP